MRIDPSKPYISMMSIPRELETTIYRPGQAPVTTRFNYAYSGGGIPLLVSTIKRVLGLPVNHVMVITFGSFKRAVDEMGCVYSTIDRRYYHINVPGGEQYQESNLQPGYQELCGTQALEFVSYRHGDTSLVRDARDQSLLRCRPKRRAAGDRRANAARYRSRPHERRCEQSNCKAQSGRDSGPHQHPGDNGPQPNPGIACRAPDALGRTAARDCTDHTPTRPRGAPRPATRQLGSKRDTQRGPRRRPDRGTRVSELATD